MDNLVSAQDEQSASILIELCRTHRTSEAGLDDRLHRVRVVNAYFVHSIDYRQKPI
jgi:hypothetical protein